MKYKLSIIINNSTVKEIKEVEFNEIHTITQSENYSSFVFANNKRNTENSTPQNMLIYDVDFDTYMSLEDAIKLCMNFKSLIVTTKSHQVEKNGIVSDRYRIIIPLDGNIEKELYKELYLKFAQSVGIDTSIDRACNDLARYYYPSSTQEYFYSKSELILKYEDLMDLIKPKLASRESIINDDLKPNQLDSNFTFKDGSKFYQYEYLQDSETKPIRCFNPQHEDIHPSAFIGRSNKSHALFAKCTACGEIKFISYKEDRMKESIAFENSLCTIEEPKLPSITPDMLPSSISGWVQDVCERIESPFEIGAVTALTLIGSLIGNKVGLRPKARDSWTVVPNLWGMIIGNPSIKKTPVYSELCKSVTRLEANAAKDFVKAQKDYEIELEVYKIKVNKLKKDGDLDKLKTLNEPIKPKAKRFTTSDGTIEAISEIIKNNPNGLLVTRDELSGFLNSMDKQGKETDRAFYLEAWNGTNSFSVDRIARGSSYIQMLTLSLLGNIQPSMIKKYIYEAVKGNKADGFLQRFQLCVYVEAVPQKLIDRIPNKELRDDFYRIIELIADNQYYYGAQQDDFESLPFYRFDEKAQMIFNKWFLNNVKEAENAVNEAYEGHLSKYPNLFASLCLIFHLCDTVDSLNNSCSYNINESTANKVVKLITVLQAHAERLYSTYEIEEERENQMIDNILAFLSKQTLPIKYRDVTFKVKGKPRNATIKKAIYGIFKDSGSQIIARI